MLLLSADNLNHRSFSALEWNNYDCNYTNFTCHSCFFEFWITYIFLGLFHAVTFCGNLVKFKILKIDNQNVNSFLLHQCDIHLYIKLHAISVFKIHHFFTLYQIKSQCYAKSIRAICLHLVFYLKMLHVQYWKCCLYSSPNKLLCIKFLPIFNGKSLSWIWAMACWLVYK